MRPTFDDGEQIAASTAIDRLDRGDIVAFHYPLDESKRFVSRIIGLPNEQIEMRDGRVFIDGRPLDESYVAHRSSDTWGPHSIPDGAYFMMGDNRANASDSRHWGSVRGELVWAKIVIWTPR